VTSGPWGLAPCYERRLVSATTATTIPMMAAVPRPQTTGANEGLIAITRGNLTRRTQGSVSSRERRYCVAPHGPLWTIKNCLT